MHRLTHRQTHTGIVVWVVQHVNIHNNKGTRQAVFVCVGGKAYVYVCVLVDQCIYCTALTEEGSICAVLYYGLNVCFCVCVIGRHSLVLCSFFTGNIFNCRNVLVQMYHHQSVYYRVAADNKLDCIMQSFFASYFPLVFLKTCFQKCQWTCGLGPWWDVWYHSHIYIVNGMLQLADSLSI